MASKFIDYLIEIKYSDKTKKRRELWDVEGIIKDRSNQKFKFDLRPLQKQPGGSIGKTGKFSSKADKIVFETQNNWILVDTRELHNRLRKTKDKIVHLKDLLDTLEWNMIIKK
tara:strand:- start:2419 stop:2757 length:339 start_codon:yes stop_codon:yes gene_type:complete